MTLLEHSSLYFVLHRLKREMDYQKEEMQSRRRGELNTQGELTYFKKETERLQSDMEKIIWYKQEYTSLTYANDSLKLDISGLQEKIETVLCEKVNLENHHQEVVRALDSEREARNELAQQLRDESLHSPSQLAWAEESAGHLIEGLGTKLGSPGSTSNHVTHSTPFTALQSQQLLVCYSELQSSIISSSDTSELNTLQNRNWEKLKRTLGTFNCSHFCPQCIWKSIIDSMDSPMVLTLSVGSWWCH